MSAADLETYEQRVVHATKRLNDFTAQLAAELDEQSGGFRWWAGFSDWKTITMLSDYLLQSLGGAEESLLSASLVAEIHRQTVADENTAFRTAVEDFKASGSTAIDTFLGLMLNSPTARRRSLTITESAESCLFHLGQTLDRIAAAVIIVGGFAFKDVATAYWSDLTTIAAELSAGSAKAMYEPAGTPGRAEQDALVAPVSGWQQFGPPDWLPWLRDARNGLTHRSPAKKFNAASGDRMVRLFYRQPRWSEVQAMVYTSKPPNRPIFDTLIMTGSEDVLDGLCDSVALLVEALADAMVSCWAVRRASPTMIVQHGRQWRKIEPDDVLSQFPGYGDPVALQGDIRVGTIDSKRFLAARITDDRRGEWYR